MRGPGKISQPEYLTENPFDTQCRTGYNIVLLSSGQIIYFLFSMKQRSEFVSNWGWPDFIYFIYKNCQSPPPPPPSPRNQLVVPKTNQEINEPSYEMVGVKITVTNYGQIKSYFCHFFSCWFFIFFSDNSKCFHRNGFEMYILIIIYTVQLYMRYVSSDEDFKFRDFLVLFRFPQMGPRVIHYYRFQCFCPVFRINWLSRNEIHCSW